MTITRPQHVTEKLQEARYFFGFMEFLERQHIDAVRNHEPAFMGDQYLRFKQYQYNFSGLLSALRTVRFYMKEIVKAKNDDARAWERTLDDAIVMKAFTALRNMDIHERTMTIPQQHSFRIPQPGDDPAELEFSEQIAFVLSREALEELPRIQKHPRREEVLNYLTSRPLTAVALDAVEAHAVAAAEGRSLCHLRFDV